MTNIVQHFGKAVQETCDRDPLKARRLLRLGYHVKNLQFRIAPGKLNSAARLAARSTTAAMVAPLDHPEDAVMVTLFTRVKCSTSPTKPSSTAHLAPPFSPWNYKMTAACRIGMLPLWETVKYKNHCPHKGSFSYGKKI